MTREEFISKWAREWEEDCARELDALLAAARRAGAEEMRKRCTAAVEALVIRLPSQYELFVNDGIREVLSALAALPLDAAGEE